MGTIRKRLDQGVWFIDYIAADGRRMREVIGPGAENKRLARKILAQREAEATLGQHRIRPAQTPRFGEFADDWLKRREAGLRPKTRESYRGMIELHLKPRFADVRLGSITRHDIETFVADRRATGTKRGKKKLPLSATTVNYSLRLLKSILLDAIDQGHIAQSPAARVKPLRSPDGDGKERLHFLTPEEIGRLLEVATEPWRTLYAVAVGTGLRRGELLGLRWRDVDLHKGVLHVRRSLERTEDGVRESPLKTASSRRAIDLSPSLVQILLVFPAGDDPERDYVFRSGTGDNRAGLRHENGPIDPDNVDRAFKRHLDLASLADVRFHDLRHTHASLLIAAGVHPKAIQARLGHAAITVTLDRYGHLMPSAFAGVGEKLDALLKRTPTSIKKEEVGRPA